MFKKFFVLSTSAATAALSILHWQDNTSEGVAWLVACVGWSLIMFAVLSVPIVIVEGDE